ncbi:MAG: ATP-binding cassette domain-containing protein [Phycisphaerae bacterium]|nr:ATP-binding cassette domain-containing protein [Phycisphaerae bacterium]
MICTEELTFRVGTFQLDHLTIDIPTGKYFVLLGPPGAGKSIFLECLCGLRRVDSGRVFISGQDVTCTEPRLRGVGYVPQDYALFPHLSVAQNITFGLRLRRCEHQQLMSRIQDMTQLLGIQHLLPRRIAGLSGGEQQRVALARALVLQPRILLLDEPVCALDEAMRQEVCVQLLRVQQQLQLTVVHVSHNLEEAFSVADLAAILHEGRFQQIGPIDELLRRPNSEFVARFVRTENIFSGHARATMAESTRTRIELGHTAVDVPGQHTGNVKFAIRPDQILLLPEGGQASDSRNCFELQLAGWRDCGAYIRLELTGPINLVAHTTPAAFSPLRHCSRLTAVLPLESIHVLS